MKSCDTPVLLRQFFMYGLQNTDRISQRCELEPKNKHTSAVRPPSHTSAIDLVIKDLIWPSEVMEFTTVELGLGTIHFEVWLLSEELCIFLSNRPSLSKANYDHKMTILHALLNIILSYSEET